MTVTPPETGQSIKTAPELAKRWRCRAEAVREKLESGELRGFKVGKSHWRITMAEVLRYESGEPQATPEPPKRKRRRHKREAIKGPF